MKKEIPKKLLNSKYRREMWEKSKSIIRVLKKVLPVSSVHLIGSFTTKKTRPADTDFIVYLKTKEKDKKSKWAVDLCIIPNNSYGNFVLSDAEKWVKRKYGAKKSTTVKVK